MDISSMLVGKSEQLDNVDLLSGPRDFTITSVTKGSADQPLNIGLAEYERPWRPGLTMRRLLAAIWGPEADAYVGRRVRLYRDAEVTFGPSKTGGTRLSHASHLERRVTVSLPTSKGKFGSFVVAPLIESAPVKVPAKPANHSEPTADAPSEPAHELDHEPDPPTPVALRTEAQSKRLWTMLTERGLTEREHVLAWLSELLGRDVDSTKTLSKAECTRAMDALEPAPDGAPDPLWGDPDQDGAA